MKKVLILLMSLMLACGCAFAEDAVTSATLEIDKLPEAEAEENGILVVWFSPDDTTKASAYAIAAELKADLFEIPELFRQQIPQHGGTEGQQYPAGHSCASGRPVPI